MRVAWPWCSGTYYTSGGVQFLFQTDALGRYSQGFVVSNIPHGLSVAVQAAVANAGGGVDLTNAVYMTVGNQ